MSARQVRFLEPRLLRHVLFRRRPGLRDQFRHWVAVFGIVDRRAQQLVEAHGPELVVHRLPSRYRARHRDPMHAGFVHIRDAALRQHVRGQPGRRPATCIQTIQFAGFGFVNDGEQISAHAVHGRLHHPQRGVGRDRRVNRIAAFFEHPRARLRCQRLAGRYNAEFGNHHRARLVAPRRAGRVVLCKPHTTRREK